MSKDILLKEAKSFARHETFYPRYGWLTKIAHKHDTLYVKGDNNRIGVGRNMLLSMKFWGQAFKLVSKDNNAYTRTPLSYLIFGEESNGADAYIERHDTLWILLYESLLPTSVLPAWRTIINLYNSDYFTASSLELHLKNKVRIVYPEISESSLKKDVHCFIGMFVNKPEKSKSDEFIVSPFAELGYVVCDIEYDSYRFVNGPKPTLKAEVIAWSIVRFMESIGIGSVTLSELCSLESSPGLVFKLSPNDMSEYLSALPKSYSDYFQLLESAGEKIFTYKTQVVNSEILLKHIYGDKR
jgi:hypothetical protein